MIGKWTAGTLMATLVWCVADTAGWALQPVVKAQSAVAKGLSRARVSLQEGLAASQREGTPISARFEVEEGKFQLSVYVLKQEKVVEVIVDHQTGKIATVEPVTEQEELVAAKAQRAAVAKAKTTLKAATEATVKANAGYRAVSIVPALQDGHPVASVTLAKGEQFTVVRAKLD